MEKNKLILNNKLINLPLLIKDSIGDFQDEIYHKKIIIDLFIDPKLNFFVYGDYRYIHHIFSNFISNSVKFVHDGGYIKISGTFIETNDFIDCKFIIFDNGIGVSKKDFKKLYSLFEQADGSYSRKHDGAGIGLAINKRLINLMNGDLNIASVVNEFTEFSFNIKLKKGKTFNYQFVDNSGKSIIICNEQDYGNYYQYLQEIAWVYHLDYSVSKFIPTNQCFEKIIYLNKEVINSNGNEFYLNTPFCTEDVLSLFIRNKKSKTTNIMLVEDNVINREIIKSYLEGFPFQLIEFNNGKLAYEAFRQNPHKYHLILMDIHMPVMDGYRTTTLIRKHKNGKNIPIIAITANDNDSDINMCLNLGMNDHISKPVNYDELIKKINPFISS